MSAPIIRIATRKSPLALWQAHYIGKELQLRHPHRRYELVPMVTSGDTFLKQKLLDIGGKGLFVKELEEALLTNKADIAVHSSKDMPATFPQGLSLVAICKRDNPLDAFVSNHYQNVDELPAQAIVGTASLRRQSQLLAYKNDVLIKSLRGNVNTRLAKLQAKEYDAIILAAAGLERLGLNHLIKQIIPDTIMLPACGQGALCIEARTDDAAVLDLIACLNDPITATCVHTERHVNAKLGGNCHIPLAVYCQPVGTDKLSLRAKILADDGSRCIEASQTGNVQQALLMADACSQSLLDQGAGQLLGMPHHD